jgi:DNA (cytosine-5)-methyltransferase 1
MSMPSFVKVHDQFCGAGGSSLGATAAGGEVTHAWNHNKVAIATHSRNFPKTDHIETDISTVDPHQYPKATVLITSPECKHHGNGDGKKKPGKQLSMWEDDEIDPDAERSRMTMAQVVRFADVIGYEAIIVENVAEVRKWRYFEDWCVELRRLGYRLQFAYLNSAFFKPTPQSRDRLYIVCTKTYLPEPDLDYRPRGWCSYCAKDVETRQVWRNPHKPWGKWRFQYDYRCTTPGCNRVVVPYYYCAWNVIDWSLPAEKIGDRKRPLRENTRRRIKHGLKKFGPQSGVLDLAYAHGHDDRSQPLSAPYRTQTTIESRGLYVPPFVIGQQSGAAPKSITELLPTVAAAAGISLTQPPFIVPLDHGSEPTSKGPEALDRPMSAQTARQDKSLVIPPFTVPAGGPEVAPRTLLDQLNTILSRDHVGLVIPPMIVELRHNGQARGLEELLATITAGGNHHGLVWLSSYYGNDAGHPLSEALPTQTAKDKHALVQAPPFLASYYGGRDAVSPLDEAVPTIPAHNRHSVVLPEAAVSVEECRFRMLQWHEVRRGMAFPETYEILGNQRQKVEQLGNAVTPPAMEYLVRQVFAVLNPRHI